MKEIYSNDLNVVDIFTSVRGVATEPNATPTAKLYLSSTTEFPATGTTLTVVQVEVDSDPVVGYYQAIIPHALLAKKRFAKVEISYVLGAFGTITTADNYEIEQRLLSYEEVNRYLGHDITGDSHALTYDEFDKLECIVRRVVQSYCGQKFNLWEGSRRVTSARDFIPLPQHMEKLTSVSTSENLVPILNDVDVIYALEEGGLAIDKNTDFVTPGLFTRRSKNNVTHVITGVWGYEGIPSQVVQGALEVLEIFNTDDIADRRAFLSDITNDAETSKHFNWTSYVDSTGNPIADDLLDSFRIYNVGAV